MTTGLAHATHSKAGATLRLVVLREWFVDAASQTRQLLGVLWKSVAAIERLLTSRSPSAISRLIASIVVNPIYRIMPTRFWPHVCNEIIKYKPSGAHCDSATAPVSESWMLRVKASGLHLGPRSILRSWSAVAVRAMSQLGKATSCPIQLGATATFLSASGKLVAKCNSAVSARAQAVPRRRVVGVSSLNREFVHHASDEISIYSSHRGSVPRIWLIGDSV